MDVIQRKARPCPVRPRLLFCASAPCAAQFFIVFCPVVGCLKLISSHSAMTRQEIGSSGNFGNRTVRRTTGAVTLANAPVRDSADTGQTVERRPERLAFVNVRHQHLAAINKHGIHIGGSELDLIGSRAPRALMMIPAYRECRQKILEVSGADYRAGSPVKMMTEAGMRYRFSTGKVSAVCPSSVSRICPGKSR